MRVPLPPQRIATGTTGGKLTGRVELEQLEQPGWWSMGDMSLSLIERARRAGVWEERLVPLEAMATGRPAAGTCRGSSAKYLTGGENCLEFPAGYAPAWAARRPGR
jgi:hypothetical protein